ncbi:MAG: ZIP family metal transporter [Parcubacteria group bacterium]|nr:ZIP family metal transporter [Parcubacteria group bacterium]
MTLLWIIGASLAESIVSLVGRSLVFLGEERMKRFAHFFLSLSVGTLLGVIFLDIFPEALEAATANTVFSWTLAGFLLFFVLERALFYYHCHEGECSVHAVGYLVLFGDAVHNFIDGVIITLAFLVDLHLGLVTTFAVLLHELPQEIGDFIVLLHSGFSRRKVVFYNFLVALTTVLGALLAYTIVSRFAFQQLIGPALGLVAGNFLYIAASDLVPELHRHAQKKTTFVFEVFLVLLGIFLIAAGNAIL